MSEVEETIKRIQQHKGVEGVIVCSHDGIPIRSNLESGLTNHYTHFEHSLVDKCRSMLREIDPSNDLTFIRIRSKKNEILIAPDKDYSLVVIQNPTAE
ncbi:dynein light chain roadblock-type 1-like [Symsagittifera roscoffensis]|uniref:dynein light chain roadblock-type 1-like n=1 Tax=Symsagittifera roscoffensis TaxID=84072 RepID=UPI00307CAD73